MALMDKMKAQASQLAQKAQEAGKAGQAKVEDLQSKRKADALLRELGAAVYAQKSGKPGADGSTIDGLVGQISALEQAGTAVDGKDETAGAASTAPASTEATTPEGGFKLG
jgi:hypothetical protein